MNSIRMQIHTIGRVFLFMISYFIIVAIFAMIGGSIFQVDYSNRVLTKTSTQQLGSSVFNLIGTFLVIGLFMKFVDKEDFIKLGFQTKNRGKEFISGTAIGLSIMTISYLLLIYFEEIFFISVHFNFKEFIRSILLFIIVAIVEETLVRGYILKNLMHAFNKYIALILSSALFSLMHSFNPNVDLFALLNLFLAGIVLGVSYLYTKNLWFPIALHFSWNLFQTLLGFNVSGQDTYSIIEFKINERNLMNGGAFGLEGSYISIVAEIITIVGIAMYYNRKKPKHRLE
ncbi:putative transmembrane protease [Polaribacter irgensii 23-P]|uniref:Putative transmembrane protease n=1 Tax=Polaribacter irgensii 23-P TaxID=313594 RepID=A4BZH7_9FLAO|nr:CPBP family intramembrane glutamic endopeptidase [Polaribacter irgensii]EAR12570.1 putative transmembrane protease [Polaribacter irgensii 23-P]